MAKKKNENTLSYLQMPLPTGGKYSKMTKVVFGGLNNRYTIDSGELSMEKNISSEAYPYLIPCNQKNAVFSRYSNPISMSAFDDFLIVVYLKNDSIKLDYITADGDTYTGVLKDGDVTDEDCVPRSIVQFNVYDTPTDPIAGQYVKKLLVFPDRKSMFFKLDDLLDDENNDSGEDFKLYDMDVLVKDYSNKKATIDESGAKIYPPPDTASHNCYYRNTANILGTNYGTDIYAWVEYETAVEDDDGNWIPDGGTTHGWKVVVPPTMPDIKYATVHLSRVFGVDDDRVYASGFNDYTNWNLDTVGEYNESNSWCSPSQSNTKADGKFTGITTYQNHVVCFKRDFMHEIYNTKNPFRLQDIYAEGTIDNRTIQDVDGKLIFVSEDEVKIYTGSNPRVIGYNLNIPKYTYAVAGTDNKKYYLYCESGSLRRHLYVYDTFTEMWSEEEVSERVISFAHNKNGMYMICEDGVIYQLDTGTYKHEWSFETDIITNKTVDIKHIKKLQMLVDIPKFINNTPNNADDEGTSASVKVYILYDDEVFDENTSHLVYSSNKYGRLPVRVKPRKTANYGFKLHVEGIGYAKLYELEIFIEAGGDMYV